MLLERENQLISSSFVCLSSHSLSLCLFLALSPSHSLSYSEFKPFMLANNRNIFNELHCTKLTFTINRTSQPDPSPSPPSIPFAMCAPLITLMKLHYSVVVCVNNCCLLRDEKLLVPRRADYHRRRICYIEL